MLWLDPTYLGPVRQLHLVAGHSRGQQLILRSCSTESSCLSIFCRAARVLRWCFSH
jgi:hypothetical protein